MRKGTEIEIVLATQSRSGSQFLLDMVSSAVGSSRMYPQSRINGCRVDTMRNIRQELPHLFKNNLSLDNYFNKYKIRAVKLEEPSIGKAGHNLMRSAPNALWLCSLRRIEDIITSHYNINSWGYPEAKVMRLWRANLQFYEYLLLNRKKLFVVNVSDKSKNNYYSFCRFLNVEPTESLKVKFENWDIINPLERQKRLHNEQMTDKKIPPELNTLRKRYNWADQIEFRYNRLFEKCLQTN